MDDPRKPVARTDRFLDCEQALEGSFNELMDMAWEAGWTPSEAATAITSLADHYILKLIANDETLRQLVDSKLRRN